MRLRLVLPGAFGTPTNSVRRPPTTTDSLTLGERFLYAPTRCQSSCGKSVTPETCGVPFSYGFPVLPEPRGCARGRRRSPGWHLGQPKRSTTVRRAPAAAQPRRTLAGPPTWGARIRAPETRNPRNRWHGSRVVTPNGSGRSSYPPPYQLPPGCQGLSRHWTGDVCPHDEFPTWDTTTKGGPRAEAVAGGACRRRP